MDRIKALIEIYYRYQVFRIDCEELQYCDVDEPATITYFLHQAGLRLARQEGPFFKGLLHHAPEAFEALLIFLPNLPPVCEEIIERYVDGHRSRSRPSWSSRKEIVSELRVLNAYRVTYHLLNVLAPLWITITTEPAPDAEKYIFLQDCFSYYVKNTCGLRASLCHSSIALNPLLLYLCSWMIKYDVDSNMDKTLKYSMSLTPAWLWGAVRIRSKCFETRILMLTPSTCQITSDDVTAKNCSHQLDFCNLMGRGEPDPLVDQLLEVLHLHGDMKALDFHENDGGPQDEKPFPSILEDESSPAQTAIRNVLYNLYRQYGHQLFRKAAKRSWFDVTFAVLGARLAGYDREQMDEEKFDTICDKVVGISKASRHRYRRVLFDRDQILQNLEDLGCMYPNCPERQALLGLREVDAEELSLEEKEAIAKWGYGTKLCSA